MGVSRNMICRGLKGVSIPIPVFPEIVASMLKNLSARIAILFRKRFLESRLPTIVVGYPLRSYYISNYYIRKVAVKYFT